MLKAFDRMIYTIKHQYAIELVSQKYCDSKMLEKIKYHDMDKILMMMFIDKDLLIPLHRRFSTHHPYKDKKLGNDDYLEMVMDWESARFSKPDKQLNANDTLYNYHPDLADKIEPILEKLDLNHKTIPLDFSDEIYLKVEEYEVTEELVKNKIVDYIKNGNLYNEVLEECARIYMEKYND